MYDLRILNTLNARAIGAHVDSKHRAIEYVDAVGRRGVDSNEAHLAFLGFLNACGEHARAIGFDRGVRAVEAQRNAYARVHDLDPITFSRIDGERWDGADVGEYRAARRRNEVP